MDRELLAAFRRRVLAGIEDDLAREAAEVEARRASVLPPVAAAIAAARAEGRCTRAWLFGSFAWGTPVERSDVDILVASCDDPDALAAEIWRAIDRPVHVIQIENAPPSLAERVLRDGHPL